MNEIEESLAALKSRDWSDAEIDSRPRAASVAVSVRMPREMAERLFSEAERRDATPSQVIRDLVEAGLDTSEK